MYNPKFYDDTPGILEISSKDIPGRIEVAQFLMSIGISCTTIDTTTVIRDKEKLWVEPGCIIHIHGLKPVYYEHKLWIPLKKKYNLSCAFLKIAGRYQGCIVNYLKPSSCNCKQIL